MYLIEIPGKPVPKGRPRFGKNGNIYTPKRTRQYEQLVGYTVGQVIKKPLSGPVALRIRVIVKNDVYPDLDNIAKTLMDGMNGIAYTDDKQVAYLEIQRIRSEDEKIKMEIFEMKRK